MERIITLLTCSPLDPEHVSVLKSKHRAEREMLRQCLGWRSSVGGKTYQENKHGRVG